MRPLVAVLFLLVPFLIAPSGFNSGGGIGRIMGYGDSNTDEGYQEFDWSRFNTFYDDYTIYNMADGGAWSSYALRTSNDCVSGDSYTGCEDYGERQVSRFDGACRVGTANSPKDPNAGNGANALTCLDDLPHPNGQDVVVLWFGMNDGGRNPLSSWDGIYFPGIKTAWQTMLGAVNVHGTSCVITMGFPQWGSAGPAFPTIYLDRNLNREEIRDYLNGSSTPNIQSDMGASYPSQCVVVEIYDAFVSLEQSSGERAVLDLYTRCFDKGVVHGTQIDITDPYWVARMGVGVDPGGVLWDCAHMNDAGDTFIGDLMVIAIKQARENVKNP